MASWMPLRRPLIGLLTILLATVIALAAGEGLVRLMESRGRVAAARRARYEDAYAAQAFRKTGLSDAEAFRRDALGDAGFLAPFFRGYVTDEYGQPVEWLNNSSGFRSRRDFAPQPPPGTLRILALGDSILVGHRVGQDDTIGFRLEEWLRERRHRDAEVLIAAIEHPATGLYYLQSRGLRFAPHLVVLGISIGDDIAQVYFNLGAFGKYRLLGGTGDHVLELNPAADHDAQVTALRSLRLPAACLGPRGLSQAGGGTRAVAASLSNVGPTNAGDAPGATHPTGAAGSSARTATSSPLHLLAGLRGWLADRRLRHAPQAAISTWGAYVDPALFDGNALGIYLKDPPAEIDEAFRRLAFVLRGFRRVCANHGIRLAVLILPQRTQVQPPDWQATVEAYGLRPGCFDPLTPNRKIVAICRRIGVTCLDPTPALADLYRASGDSLYMPLGDAHLTARGDGAVVAAIRDQIATLTAGLP
jgi:hypothetical protein